MSYDPRWQQPPDRDVRGFTAPPQWPNPPATPPPASGRPPATWWAWAALGVSVLLLVGAGWRVYETQFKKDSGIAACEAFRDSGKVTNNANGGQFTEDQYLKLRKVFQDSRHDDIRIAGTRLMDVVWQVSKLGPNPGLEALPYLNQIMSAATDMQGACANHGIVINLNLGGAPTPAATA
jgi:hypothetical protein